MWCDRVHPCSCLSSRHRCLPPLWFHAGEVKETKLSSGSLALLSFSLCEGHQGIFSRTEERQSIKYMGKYASHGCKRTCSGLLFLLERIDLPVTQQGEESTTFFHHRLGKKVAVSCSSPLTQIWQVLVEDFFLVLGTPCSWQLLALCAGSGSAGGLGVEQSCGAVMLLGLGA